MTDPIAKRSLINAEDSGVFFFALHHATYHNDVFMFQLEGALFLKEMLPAFLKVADQRNKMLRLTEITFHYQQNQGSNSRPARCPSLRVAYLEC